MSYTQIIFVQNKATGSEGEPKSGIKLLPTIHVFSDTQTPKEEGGRLLLSCPLSGELMLFQGICSFSVISFKSILSIKFWVKLYTSFSIH